MARAYRTSMFLTVRNPEKMAAYAALARPAMEAAGGRFLARGPAAAAFEAGKVERTTLIEFPSVDAAVAAYHSPAYREALDGGADRDIRIVEAAD